VRWLFLVAIIAGLTGFVVAACIRGRTPAEGFCSLLKSPECARLAAQGESLVKTIARGLDQTPQPRAARRDARETPRASHGAPAAAREAPSNSDGRPLDQHTAGERKALSDLLLQHGSR
jgi:hypothetical protein